MAVTGILSTATLQGSHIKRARFLASFAAFFRGPNAPRITASNRHRHQKSYNARAVRRTRGNQSRTVALRRPSLSNRPTSIDHVTYSRNLNLVARSHYASIPKTCAPCKHLGQRPALLKGKAGRLKWYCAIRGGLLTSLPLVFSCPPAATPPETSGRSRCVWQTATAFRPCRPGPVTHELPASICFRFFRLLSMIDSVGRLFCYDSVRGIVSIFANHVDVSPPGLGGAEASLGLAKPNRGKSAALVGDRLRRLLRCRQWEKR